MLIGTREVWGVVSRRYRSFVDNQLLGGFLHRPRRNPSCDTDSELVQSIYDQLGYMAIMPYREPGYITVFLKTRRAGYWRDQQRPPFFSKRKQVFALLGA